MILISRVYRFNAAHMLNGAGHCDRLHGHNWEATVDLWSSPRLNAPLIVLYDEVDKIVKPIIDSLDHRLLLGSVNSRHLDQAQVDVLTGLGAIFLPVTLTSTEGLAQYLGHQIQSSLLETDVQIARLHLVETPRNSATWFPEFSPLSSLSLPSSRPQPSTEASID